MPRHKNQVNFDPNNSNQAFFDSLTKNKSIPIPALKSNQFRSPTLKSSQFRLPAQKPSQFRCKTSAFRPAHKSQVDFDHPYKTKSTDPHIKNKSFLARPQKPSPPHNQAKFDPNPEIKSISIPTLKFRQCRCPDTKTKSISTTHAKSESIPTPTLKSSQFLSLIHI